MGLTCDRCFIGLSFLGSFKLSPSSDFDFCKDCWLRVVSKESSDELSHYRGADTNSCDLREFLKICIATNRFLSSPKVAIAPPSGGPQVPSGAEVADVPGSPGDDEPSGE